jgi:hypothetical protein
LLVAAQQSGVIVVRSAPVQRVGTFLEETVDMEKHAAVLTDTLSTLAFLVSEGKIDAATREAAEQYLERIDKRWPFAVTIQQASELYLDALSVTYLDYVGLLEPLTQAVERVFIHPDVDLEMQRWLHEGKNSDELLAAIDRIRTAVSKALEEGDVNFSSRRDAAKRPAGGPGDGNDDDDDEIKSSPSLDLMSDLSAIDAVASDDRCLNKLPTWTDGAGRSASAISTIHLLDALRTTGALISARATSCVRRDITGCRGNRLNFGCILWRHQLPTRNCVKRPSSARSARPRCCLW